MIEHDGSSLKNHMETMTRLFGELAEQEKCLQDCLIRKDWQGLESIIGSMGRLSDRIESVEADRVECTAQLKRAFRLPATASFYETIVLLQEPLRSECAAAYRNMKCAVLLVESFAGNINSFVTTATTSLREILEELYPHRKGKLYTRSGKARISRDDALVLNRRL